MRLAQFDDEKLWNSWKREIISQQNIQQMSKTAPDKLSTLVKGMMRFKSDESEKMMQAF